MAINALNTPLRPDAAAIDKEYQLKEIEKNTQADSRSDGHTKKTAQSADSFDSAPDFEYFNNYTQNGKNHYAAQMQPPTSEPLSAVANIEVATNAAVTEAQSNDTAAPLSAAASIEAVASAAAAEAQSNDTAEPLTDLERAMQALKENEEFIRLSSRSSQPCTSNLRNIDEWHELGIQIIKNMSSEEYELLQKMFWSNIRNHLAGTIERLNSLRRGDNPTLSDDHRARQIAEAEDTIRSLSGNIKDSHLDYSLIELWNNNPPSLGKFVRNACTVQHSYTWQWHKNMPAEQVKAASFRNTMHSFMFQKMRTEGLTEAERLFKPRLAQREEREGPNATFPNRMGSIADYVNARFAEAQRPLPAIERFTITFNNDLTFRVRGGTGDDAEFIQNILNNADRWLMSRVMDSIFFHRGENGEVHPWLQANNTWQQIAIERGVGFTELPDEFMNGLPRLSNAHMRHKTEELIQRVHGFGLDDVYIRNGELRGKTDEITAIINSQRFRDLHHEGAIRSAINIPREHDLSFFSMTFENGRFTLTH